MQRIKPVIILEIKKIIEAREDADDFLDWLSPAAAHVYQQLDQHTLLTPEIDGEFLEAGAKFLHPEDADPLPRLGREMADVVSAKLIRTSMIGPAMSVFFKQVVQHLKAQGQAGAAGTLSIDFIFNHLPELWRQFYDEGEARISDVTSSSALLTMCQLPDMPPPVRKFLKGFLQRLLEISGAKNVRVGLDESDPAAWKWPLQWEA